MEITKEFLEARLEELRKVLQQMEANRYAQQGGIQAYEKLLAEVVKSEAVKTDEK